MIGTRRMGCVIWLTLWVSACGAPTNGDPPSGSERVSRTPLGIAASATVSIGADDSGYPLNNVNGALRLSDGHIVIADGGLNSRVSVFDTRGEYVGQLGRSGDGPGEYGWISSIQQGPEDSVYLYDESLQRLSVFVREGGFARSVSFQPAAVEGERLLSLRRLGANRWVGVGSESVRPGPPGVILRDTVAVALLNSALTDFDVLDRVPGRMTTHTVVMGRPLAHLPSFTPEVTTTTWGRCVFVSDGESPTVSVYDADGDPVLEFTGPGDARAVTAEHVAGRLARQIAALPDADPRMWERILADEARPSSLPFYHRVTADEWGRIWLQEYAPPSGVGSRFYVVSQRGRPLAQVDAPVAMRALSIGDGGVLARIVGELGVEVVELRPFVDGSGPMADPHPKCVVD